MNTLNNIVYPSCYQMISSDSEKVPKATIGIVGSVLHGISNQTNGVTHPFHNKTLLLIFINLINFIYLLSINYVIKILTYTIWTVQISNLYRRYCPDVISLTTTAVRQSYSRNLFLLPYPGGGRINIRRYSIPVFARLSCIAAWIFGVDAWRLIHQPCYCAHGLSDSPVPVLSRYTNPEQRG